MSNSKSHPQDSDDLDIEEIREFYDTVYYGDGSGGGGASLRRHNEALANKIGLRPGSRVLDVACGTGGWLQVCRNRGCDVAGVDLSQRAIEACQQQMPDGEFHAQPAETLPFEDQQFDVVTCLGSLEHFVDPLSSLREMVRVAKPGATFLILVPNKDFLTRKIGLFAGTYQVDALEVVRSLEEWQALFGDAGLEVESRWKDLHVLNKHWITTGKPYTWPLRAVQAVALPLWPLRWQYQVYHRCKARPS